MKKVNIFLRIAIILAIISVIASIANIFIQDEKLKMILWIIPFIVICLDMLGMFEINFKLSAECTRLLEDREQLIRYQLFLSEYENEYKLSAKESFTRFEIIKFLEEEKADWQLKEYNDNI